MTDSSIVPVHLLPAEFEHKATANLRDPYHRLVNRAGQPFRCDSITVIWQAAGDDPLMLNHIQVRGKAILKNGNVGRSERFVWFEARYDPRLMFGPPLNTAPEWVREFVRYSRPDSRTVADVATCP